MGPIKEPLNHMGTEFHATAISKGWWDPPAEMIEATEVAIIRVDKLLEAWGVYISEGDIRRTLIRATITDALVATWPKRNVGELLMLCVSELAEAFEEYRIGKFDEVYVAAGKPEGGPIELADAIIRITEMAAERGMDLDEAVRHKAAFNKSRPHRHGGKLA